ncbi:hypothetical protein TRIATDRAFT_38560 [Trichoderma atroviride IMI 206040]|uniref:Zn(2)-C6 fungal-type domain-containing protein n=1 Tax=Hypocrea atroviridis (strain ATCC 20476 / IMI 206040) TaxID=452589 RepID=G9NV76_HYPAI|nr:uncharacterized protein TRIATDRAFT_38560 [Trichoderma atroviride IMI 206040]EHK44897.1 hypothetical protein TRIATDRAFT_38560 [Trichoderma atroviride IMI 206040]
MAKRSCDFCVQRKTRCDNGSPCRKCLDAQPPLDCTYSRPVLKRGPKTSKLTQRCNWKWRAEGQRQPRVASSCLDADSLGIAADVSASCYLKTERLALSILKPIIECYSSRLYPVWPVLYASSLLAMLEDAEANTLASLPSLLCIDDVYIMALALCSATMAQLNLGEMEDMSSHITSEYLEKECNRLRALTSYRENPSVEGALTSFFLHVYHARADNRNASMLFLQEGISIARLLRLDRIESEPSQLPNDWTDNQTTVIAQKRLVYILLWVSERGYAIQHDLPISILDTVQIPSAKLDDFDKYGKGLVELATLFVAFDAFFYRTTRYMHETSQPHSEKYRLITVQESLKTITPKLSEYDLVQQADYTITRHWMRVLLWQQAMSRSLLSSYAEHDSMTFLFPSQIAQEFLTSITMNSTEQLTSLGRDQLIKSFEVTNTLADVILCTTSAYNQSWKCGPADFLHALYQIISPFLTYDRRLYDMIRLKAADALLQAPSRIIPRSVDRVFKDTEMDADEEEDRGLILETVSELTAEADARNVESEGLGRLDDIEELLW